jgi:6-phospho-3-hexuloisomerase
MNSEFSFDLTSLGRRACRDLENVFERVDPAHLEVLGRELIAARRIVCYGVGREGLKMAAIAMRLMHAGFQSYVVGEMVTPPVAGAMSFLRAPGRGIFPP